MLKHLLIGMLLCMTPALAQTPPQKQCGSVEKTMKQLDDTGFKVAFTGILSMEKKIVATIYTNGPLFVEFVVANGTMCPMISGSGFFLRMQKDRSQAE
jgi:hypothetical protein